MTTNSYPAVGNNGFLTDEQWAKIYNPQDGIIEDYHTGGVSSLSLTRNNTTNMCTVSPGLVQINGYTLEVTAAHELHCPPVGSGSVTYYIAALYDPALNVAEVGGGRSALGPCRLVIDTTLSTLGGKAYTVLYAITRAAQQSLTAAPVIDYRRWIGPVVVLPDYPSTFPTGFGPFPRGTLLIETDADGVADVVNVSVRTVNAAGSALEWQNTTAPPAKAFPSALVAQGAPAQVQRFAGRMIGLSGTLRRSSGAKLGTGSPVLLGTLAAGDRPARDIGPFVVGAAGNVEGLARIYVGADGAVTLSYGPGQADISWLALDGITFRAGA